MTHHPVNVKLIDCQFDLRTFIGDMRSRKVDEKFLVIGLGNPGRQYLRSRHNVGFMLVDRLAGEMTTRFSRLHANALISQGCIGSSKVILAKPQTFMNLSGEAAKRILDCICPAMRDCSGVTTQKEEMDSI